MSDTSPRLSLPYIQPNQAQKHVTHNEGMALLDALVQLAVESRSVTVPPPAPGPTVRHIVPDGATGLWAGQQGRVAVRAEGGGWVFVTPAPGWRAWVADESVMVLRQGSAWVDLVAARLAGGIAQLGINTAVAGADRLAVAGEAVLFTHQGGDHRIKVNKGTATDTASLVFQTGFSGRAEMGLAGSDGFAVRVSADGATFRTALSVTAATGVPDLRAGATVDGRAIFTRGNVLGSVSQTGGVPAGAVLERGAGANGEFLRLADGTLICWRAGLQAPAVSTAEGALWRSADVTWTYPAAFAAAPVVTGSAEEAGVWVTAALPGTGSCGLRLMAAVSRAGAVPFRVMAVGRWV
jgi:hypothetical protein